MHRGLLLLLVLFTCWAWYPIVHWVWDHHPLRLGVSTGDATDLSYRLFHEAGCRGESFALTGAADLCGRAYPSGGHSNPDSQPPPPLSHTHSGHTQSWHTIEHMGRSIARRCRPPYAHPPLPQDHHKTTAPTPGAEVKDNVASVLLVGSGHKLNVYGTCRLSERLPNPMLLETIKREGCVDLKYPLCASVELLEKDVGDGEETNEL